MMVDLETLDTKPSAIVVSVGAVVFDKEKILRKAYWVLNRKEQIQHGRTASADTIDWWMQQSDTVREVFKQPTISSFIEFPLYFSQFFKEKKLHLWGNGADFDLSILMDFWIRHNLINVPEWKHYNHMCFRTVNNTHNIKKLIKRTGVHHNALDDASYQAECVIAHYQNQNLKNASA